MISGLLLDSGNQEIIAGTPYQCPIINVTGWNRLEVTVQVVAHDAALDSTFVVRHYMDAAGTLLMASPAIGAAITGPGFRQLIMGDAQSANTYGATLSAQIAHLPEWMRIQFTLGAQTATTVTARYWIRGRTNG